MNCLELATYEHWLHQYRWNHFPSGLKCRHSSVKLPNFWCQVSHQLQINHLSALWRTQLHCQFQTPAAVPCPWAAVEVSSLASQSWQEEQKTPNSNGFLLWAFSNALLLFLFFQSVHSNTIIPQLSYIWRGKKRE